MTAIFVLFTFNILAVIVLWYINPKTLFLYVIKREWSNVRCSTRQVNDQTNDDDATIVQHARLTSCEHRLAEHARTTHCGKATHLVV